MNKIVDTVEFVIGARHFKGQINMRRDKSPDSKTTFFGTCSEKPRGQIFQASDKDIDVVRESLYDQANEMYGVKNWEKWVLIVVHLDSTRDWDIDHKRGMDAPRRQDIGLRIQVDRYLRFEKDGKEIWTDYCRKVPKPEVDTNTDEKESGFRLGERFVGALIRDDESARAFIERMKLGFISMQAQMEEFLKQDNIERSIERTLVAPDRILLEVSPNGVQG